MLTIIIPTRNRSKRLSDLIESFSNLNQTKFEWEVLIIDNASNDDTKQTVNKLKNKFKFKINYFYEKKIGLHYARNSGVRECKTPYLVLLDDDMFVSKTWLDEFDILLNDKADAYVGKILPFWETNPPWWLRLLVRGGTYPYLGLLNLGNYIKKIDPLFLYGGNLFIKKKVITKLNGFNPDGFPNELIKYRGDGEGGLMKKFKKANYRSYYVPSAKVYHIMHSSRTNLDYLCKRAYNEGISNSFSQLRDKKNNIGKVSKFLKIKKIFSFSRIVRFIIEDILLYSIKIKINKKLKEGFDFHQNEIKKDKNLLNYVLKENFIDD